MTDQIETHVHRVPAAEIQKPKNGEREKMENWSPMISEHLVYKLRSAMPRMRTRWLGPGPKQPQR